MVAGLCAIILLDEQDSNRFFFGGGITKLQCLQGVDCLAGMSFALNVTVETTGSWLPVDMVCWTGVRCQSTWSAAVHS